MVLPKYKRGGAVFGILLGISSSFIASDGFAQAGTPVPGSSYSAPVPGQPTQMAIPTRSSSGSMTGYDKLPLNAGNAQARLEELRNLMSASRPKEFQDAIAEYCDWLSDMADAHWKLSQTFSKHETTKSSAESERQLALRFGQLKRQAMLLKAEFLITQRRYPEALGPLVDIVVAEPRTETGQQAYRLLQEIGFSDVAVRNENAASAASVAH